MIEENNVSKTFFLKPCIKFGVSRDQWYIVFKG